jgi:hypothetical protein
MVANFEQNKHFASNAEVQVVIEWLLSQNLPPLPVAPRQNAKEYPKVVKAEPAKQTWNHCPLEDLQAIALFTGKNPSFLDRHGIPHLVNHRQYQSKLPSASDLIEWFTNPINGIGTLGGHGRVVWLDFDIKHFASELECSNEVKSWFESHPELKETFCERTHSNGWRIGVKVKQKPNFTNFALCRDGDHVGEALGAGRFTVLAPTIGPSGNAYCSIKRTFLAEVESLEAIGIYPTHKNKPLLERVHQPSLSAVPGGIPLDMLLNNQSRAILNGENPTGDRSEALTILIREAYGWENWAKENGVSIRDSAQELAHSVGTVLDIDSNRIGRILKTIDLSSCRPAAAYKGDELSCWRKVRRLDKATYEAKCPRFIKDTIAQEPHLSAGQPFSSRKNSVDRDDSSSGGNTPLIEESSLCTHVQEILNHNYSSAEREEAFSKLAKSTGYQPSLVEKIAKAIESDVDFEAETAEAKVSLPNLLKNRNQDLNPSDYLWGDGGRLAIAINTTAAAMPTAKAKIFSTFIAASASRIGTSSRIIVKASAKYVQPCIFWVAVISRSGRLKTPAQLIAIEPLVNLEVQAKQVYEKAKKDYEEAQKTWQEGEAAPTNPAPRKRYLTKDSTLETLERIHSDNPRGLLYYRDELVGMSKSQNAFKPSGRGADQEAELDQWNGSSLIVDRKEREICLHKTAISRTGSIQYDVMKKLAGDHEDSNGSLARWLLCAVKAPPRHINFDDAPDTGISSLLETLYCNLEKLPDQDYLIDKDSQAIFKAWQNHLVDAECEENHPGLQLVYPKIEAYTARLALWLHCINAVLAGEIPTPSISGTTMQKAVELASFFLGQAQLVYATNSPQSGLTGRLLTLYSYVEGKVRGVIPRQIKTNLNCYKKIPTPEIRRDCQTLVENGYFRSSGDTFFSDVDDSVGVVGDLLAAPPTSEVPQSQSSQGSVGDVGKFEKHCFFDLQSCVVNEPAQIPYTKTTNNTNKVVETSVEADVDVVDDLLSETTNNHQNTNNKTECEPAITQAIKSKPPQPETRPTHSVPVFQVGGYCRYCGPEGAMAVTCCSKDLEVLNTRINEQGEHEVEVKAANWCTSYWVLARHLRKVKRSP